MTLATGLSILQTLSVVLAIVIAISTIRGNGDKKTEELTEMRVDIKYIKQRIDGLDEIRDIAREARARADAANDRMDRHLKYDHQKDIERRQDNAK